MGLRNNKMKYIIKSKRSF